MSFREQRPGAGNVDSSTRDAYAALIADTTIFRFLVRANCAVEEALVRDAVRRRFGAGMLENVVTILDLPAIDEPWAKVLATR